MFIFRLIFSPLMLLYQSMFLAFSQIWANKVRGFLTTVGIMIGVAAVTAVIALITGMKAKVLEDFAAYGTNKMFISPHWPDKKARKNLTWQDIMFKPNDFEDFLSQCPSISKYTRVGHMWVQSVSYGPKSETENISVSGIDPDWHDIENRHVILGRPLSVMDSTQIRPVCLINDVVREKLDLGKDPTGQFIMLDGSRMLIVGVLEAPAGTIGVDSDELEIIVPYTWAYLRQRWGYTSVLATARDTQKCEDARAEAEFYLRHRRHVKIGEENTFSIRLAQRMVDKFNEESSFMTTIALGIVGISLLVGGVGIMNIMLVSVSERTREIGLRKAVGARPAAILLQFLVEAIVLCLLGGAMGLIVGQILTSTVASFIPKQMRIDHMVIPPSAVALAFGFSAVVGMVFGMFPAIKASRLDPIEALRHE